MSLSISILPDAVLCVCVCMIENQTKTNTEDTESWWAIKMLDLEQAHIMRQYKLIPKYQKFIFNNTCKLPPMAIIQQFKQSIFRIVQLISDQCTELEFIGGVPYWGKIRPQCYWYHLQECKETNTVWVGQDVCVCVCCVKTINLIKFSFHVRIQRNALDFGLYT